MSINKEKNKIALVIPYDGELPKIFTLFKESVRNKPVDILFFTPLQQPDNLPSNIKWNYFSPSSFYESVLLKLGVQIELRNTYKICDFRPAFGLLFAGYLSGYEFWGSIDIDTIVGDFQSFVTDDILNSIDVFSGIKGYISGSFFLLRNNDYCNNLFKKSKDWLTVMQVQKYMAFDECGGRYFEQLKAGRSILELNTPIQSFTEVVILEMQQGLRVLFTNAIAEPKGTQAVTIKNEGVFYKNESYLLLHLIFFKAFYGFYVNTSVHPPYYVSHFGTFQKKPSLFNLLISPNFSFAAKRKLQINFRKLKKKM